VTALDNVRAEEDSTQFSAILPAVNIRNSAVIRSSASLLNKFRRAEGVVRCGDRRGAAALDFRRIIIPIHPVETRRSTLRVLFIA